MEAPFMEGPIQRPEQEFPLPEGVPQLPIEEHGVEVGVDLGVDLREPQQAY